MSTAPASLHTSRPSVIQLSIKEKAALYAAYISIFAEGGIFIPSTREYHALYGLTKDRERLMKPDAIVCHPGPINRGVEFDSYMADHPRRSVILDQVYAGICVRMAVLYLLLGGSDNGLDS